VLAAPDSRPGVASGIVVELIAPNETFWGFDLQVNKTIVELESLEKALKGEGIDPRLVREYRDAIDSIIGITDTLRRLRTPSPRNSDYEELLASLAANRIRRASSVCLNVVADLDAGHIRQDSGAVEELAGTVQQLQQRLKQCSKSAIPGKKASLGETSPK